MFKERKIVFEQGKEGHYPPRFLYVRVCSVCGTWFEPTNDNKGNCPSCAVLRVVNGEPYA